MAQRKPSEGVERYPRLFLEALAYHEAGHAVMAALLQLPIASVAIGPACDEPGYNGKVHLDLDACGEVPRYKAVLLEVASERAEQLCPRHSEFRTIHKRHPHLKPFSLGLKGDLASGFEIAKVVYLLMGLAESTARRQFKTEYREPAADLIGLNAAAVHRLAECLTRTHLLPGAEATSLILADGPLKHGGLLTHFGYPEEGTTLAARETTEAPAVPSGTSKMLPRSPGT